VTDQDKIWQIS